MGRPKKTPAVVAKEAVVEDLLVEPIEITPKWEDAILRLEKRIEALEKTLPPKKAQPVCVETPAAS